MNFVAVDVDCDVFGLDLAAEFALGAFDRNDLILEFDRYACGKRDV